MKTVIGIGGGELAENETIGIDRYIVSLAQKAGKTVPQVLFIPTASHDSQGYAERFRAVYEGLGCRVSVANLTKAPNINAVRSLIFSSDIIYVGGGNTAYMMSVWKRLRVDEMLKTAYERGIVLAGLSAGAICWCKSGYSDSNPDSMAFVKGLGLVPVTVCPHYGEPERAGFDAEIKGERAVALENRTAFIYTDSGLKFARCGSSKTAYIFDDGGKKEVEDWISI